MRALAACLLLVGLASTGVASSASFDCTKARTRVEGMICASPGLGALDERLAAAFKALGGEQTGNEWGRYAPRSDDQRRWLREVRDRCRDAACLDSAYTARIAELERWHAPAPIDASLDGRYMVEHQVGFVMGGDKPEIETVSDCLSLVPRKDEGWDLAISSMSTNGHTCGFAGKVRQEGDVLRAVPGSFEDFHMEDEPACTLGVRVEKGELRVQVEDGCRFFCGMRAQLDGLVFPRNFRQPGPAAACIGIDDEPMRSDK